MYPWQRKKGGGGLNTARLYIMLPWQRKKGGGGLNTARLNIMLPWQRKMWMIPIFR